MNVKEKKILVIGLARSGLAAIRLLHAAGADNIILTEQKEVSEKAELEEYGVKILPQSDEVFKEDYDLVIKNPGISPLKDFVVSFRERNIPVITEIELAYQLCRPQHYIAITGTNGKTTTTTLAYEFLKKAYGDKAHVAGNIGIPLCEVALKNDLMNKEGHYIALEMSQGQLVDIDEFCPDVSCIINLTPDHIDFMGSLENYYLSKTLVYKNMKSSGTFILNIDDDEILKYTDKRPVPCSVKTLSVKKEADACIKDGRITVNGQDIMAASEVPIPGEHNLQNILFSACACMQAGVSAKDIADVIKTFPGVEHRIEFVREIDGVRYYNDSKATNTDASITALKSFTHGVILLVGGFEKGLSMDEMKKYLGCVKAIIGYGASGKRIAFDLAGIPQETDPSEKNLADSKGRSVQIVTDMHEAVAAARALAVKGDVILLSPTTSSFDQYPNFEERGKHFKKIVKELLCKDDYIGIFDSGIGGLTVFKSIMDKMPEEKLIYFGDTAHVPYGTKSHKQIRAYAMQDVNFLTRFNLKALVIACNTADSVARQTLKDNFNLPIFGVIEPASRKAAAITKNNRIGVMATAATVRSGSYQEMIHKYNPEVEVFPLACPLLVPLVEDGRFKKEDKVVQLLLTEYLDKLKEHNVDTIVLGCTHYPLLEDAVKNLIPDINVISSSEAAAAYLSEGLTEMNLDRQSGIPEYRYYVSDDPEHFKENASIFMGHELEEDVLLVSDTQL